MKKLAALSACLGYLALSFSALAQTNIIITRPPFGFGDINEFINNTIILAFIIAIVLVLAMLIWGAIQWISAGGDKEALASARSRIINSLIGMAILAIAFAIFQLAGTFLGLIGPAGLNFPIPRPGTIPGP